MKSSRNPSSGRGLRASSVKGTRRFTGDSQPSLFSRQQMLVKGAMNDVALIRDVIYAAIAKCSKSREQIAEEMTWLVGREVTVRLLNGVTAESQDEYRWNADLDRAFCFVTGDERLLTCRAELAGLHVIDEAGWHLLELGREYLREKDAAANRVALEARLRGVHLG